MTAFDKKTDRIEVRVSPNEKAKFTSACDSQGDTTSSALRRFMTGYIYRANSDAIKTGLRTLVFGKTRGRAAIAGVTAILAVGLMAGSIIGSEALAHDKTRPKAETFALLDWDNSGVIELGEIGRDEKWVHLAFDTDGTPGISLKEFRGDLGFTVRFTPKDNGTSVTPVCVMTVFRMTDFQRDPSERHISGVVTPPYDKMVEAGRDELCADGSITVDSGTNAVIERDF